MAGFGSRTVPWYCPSYVYSWWTSCQKMIKKYNFAGKNSKIFKILKMQFFKPRPPTGFNRNLVPPPIPKSQNQDKLKQLGSSSTCSQDSSNISRLLSLASYLDFTFTHGTTRDLRVSWALRAVQDSRVQTLREKLCFPRMMFIKL